MSKTVEILGEQAGYYLSHVCRTIDKKSLYLPGPDTVERIWTDSDRNIRTLGSLRWILSNGRLGGTGYVSILPVDQGIEHSAGASFAPNPAYFDPENIVKLALEGGCNAVASTFGVLGAVARKYAHRIPFIVKLNHNELLSYPNSYDQVLFGSVRDAWNMGAAAVGATIYFGSEQSRRRWSRSPVPSTRRMNWAWRRSCGVTCATRDSKRRASITMPRPTSRGRPTIWA